MRRLLACIVILRPHNMLATAAAVSCGYYLGGGETFERVTAPVAFAAWITGLGNLINDYFDAAIDRVNKPRRPIPAGHLRRGFVHHLYWVGTILMTALMVVWLSRGVFLVMLAWQALLYLYGRFGKRVVLSGNLVVAAVVASSFVVGAMVAGDIRPVAFPGLLAFLLVIGRELLKGAEDVVGDARAGAQTFAIRWGEGRAVVWGALPLFACVVVAPVPVFLEVYTRAYGVVIEILFAPGVLAAAVLALRRPCSTALNRASWILKFEMFLGILAFAVGRP